MGRTVEEIMTRDPRTVNAGDPVIDAARIMRDDDIGDVIVVDMPPGTGDVAISLGQLLPRAEALVVTTPQRAAQQVAVRAAQMARKTNMRLLGVVENMSYLAGTGEELFGSGGGQALSEEIEAPLLARIPFDPRLAALADEDRKSTR